MGLGTASKEVHLWSAFQVLRISGGSGDREKKEDLNLRYKDLGIWVT